MPTLQEWINNNRGKLSRDESWELCTHMMGEARLCVHPRDRDDFYKTLRRDSSTSPVIEIPTENFPLFFQIVGVRDLDRFLAFALSIAEECVREFHTRTRRTCRPASSACSSRISPGPRQYHTYTRADSFQYDYDLLS